MPRSTLPRVMSARYGRARGGLTGRLLLLLAASALLAHSKPALTADGLLPPGPETPSERFAIHAQATYVEQETDSFNAPYAGPNSLSPSIGRETVDATLYLGARLWSGAEAWLCPEIDQGFGLDNTLGVAGFPSGEDYKVGKKQPYLRLPRAFVRQTVNLGGSTEAVDPGQIQLGGSRSPDRWVFTVGKFSVTDIFDANQYAHDPRSDFFNWAVIDAGSFDYAADAWGYTVGAAAERYAGAWTVRAGAFDLSNIPNSQHLEPAGHEFQIILEAEQRHDWFGQPGKALVTYFQSRGRMALLDDAVRLAASTGGPVDVTPVRQYRSRVGVSVGLEQQLASGLGLFAKGGRAGGNVETYEFTDIDRTVAIGMSLNGARWARARDAVGLAAVVNRISASRERYLNAGGLGVLIGDGKLLHPGSEQILETYYSLAVLSQGFVTVDYQRVVNPGYNRDRGPASIFAVRVHAQF